VSENFREIYQLEQAKDYPGIIRAMVSDGGRIRKQYGPDLNHAWYVVGDAYYCLDEFKKALKAFRRAMFYDNSDAFALMAIANCYSSLERPQMSAIYLRRALGIKPNDAALHYNLANALFDAGKYEAAIEEYSIVVRGKSSVAKKARTNRRLALALSGKV